jgi:hypothetical protein
MRESKNKQTRKTSGNWRGDMKVGNKPTRVRKVVKQDITRDEFLANLGKVCRPTGKESSESDLEKTET